MKGWVYIITNKAMPDLLKVGYSTKDPALRANDLHNTGVPHRYVVEYDALVEEPYLVEQKVHKLLKDHHEDKEWFRCNVTEAIIAIRKVSSSSLIHESIKNEDFTNSQKNLDPNDAQTQFKLDLNATGEVIDSNIQNEVVTSQLNPKTTELIANKVGDCLSDGSVVFYIDALLRYGLAAQPKDALKRARWTEAKLLANAYGQGWHLPTKEEMALLYVQKNVVGSFASDFVSNLYWSSTEYDSIYAWSQKFSNGKQLFTIKDQTCLVRAIRTFTNTLMTKLNESVVELKEFVTYKIGDVLSDGGIIFYVDISGSHGLATRPAHETQFFNWAYAKSFIGLNYLHGWRLPAKDELLLMYHQKDMLRGNTYDYYWSSTELNSKFVSTLRFHNGDVVSASKDNKFLVRPVRSF